MEVTVKLTGWRILCYGNNIKPKNIDNMWDTNYIDIWLMGLYMIIKYDIIKI